ncbi:hypothetical protein Pan216_43900 [Planctomycetes bacterium Pan216]|uniref:Uncharacterized protein n=1 Tax=Kolteria novifilia TaxID=2527975 RepID=A0A518B953_9BACT|nr:hypothetical protein Pan216_43900 [Planctomycetes bacterium Pan216]
MPNGDDARRRNNNVIHFQSTTLFIFRTTTLFPFRTTTLFTFRTATLAHSERRRCSHSKRQRCSHSKRQRWLIPNDNALHIPNDDAVHIPNDDAVIFRTATLAHSERQRRSLMKPRVALRAPWVSNRSKHQPRRGCLIVGNRPGSRPTPPTKGAPTSPGPSCVPLFGRRSGRPRRRAKGRRWRRRRDGGRLRRRSRPTCCSRALPESGNSPWYRPPAVR